MTTPLPEEPTAGELKPKFLDLIENGWASEGNPHRVGIYLKTGRRAGKMNPGKYFVLTDGKGDEWEVSANSEKLSIVGHYPAPKVSEPSERPLINPVAVNAGADKIRRKMSATFAQPDWGHHIDKGPGATHFKGDDCDVADGTCPSCHKPTARPYNERGECITCGRDRILGTGKTPAAKQMFHNVGLNWPKPPEGQLPSGEASELDEVLRMAFVGLYGRDPEGDYVPMEDSYGVLRDSLKRDLQSIITAAEVRGAARELENFNPFFDGDHRKCTGYPASCIGYQNAVSDYENEREMRLATLRQAGGEK